MEDPLEHGDAGRNEMPAAMNRHAIQNVGPINPAAIFRPFLPRWIIGKTCDHLDVVPLLHQKLAEGHVVGGDAGKFRRVVDSPDDDAHRDQSLGAVFVRVSS
jgi:hypothetical protein